MTGEARPERSVFDCVVDASVGVKLFVVEPLSDQADALFGHLTDTPPARLYVPDLFFIECASILWKYVRRYGYPADVARQDLRDLTRLPLRVVSTAALAEEALTLGVAHGSTAYDSAYVALARRLALPLVTADEALARRFVEAEPDVQSLRQWGVGMGGRA